MSGLRIRTKLLFPILALIPIFLLLIWLNYRGVQETEIATRHFESYGLVVAANRSYKDFLNGVADAVDTGKLGASALTALQEAAAALAKAKALNPGSQDDALAANIAQLAATLGNKADLASLTAAKAAIRDFDQTLSEQLNKQHTGMGTMLATAAKDAKHESIWIILVGGLLFALSVLFLRSVMNSINRPLGHAIAVANRIAAGRLDNRIEVNGNNEIDQLLKALAAMSERLQSMIAEIRATASGINRASAEIVANNNELSGRTESQASTLEQTTASIEEFTAGVNQTSASALEARQRAEVAARHAETSGVGVERVVETMAMIRARSKQIVDIIAVIDGIAFQTNILALNAAVEAARAGEQGRGFAVVAGEVRSLAQRSAQAAKEIKLLITESVERIASGAQLAHDVGTSMATTVAGIQDVHRIMAAIATSSTEQSAGIGQMNQAMGQLDQATQLNVSIVERAAAIAADLDAHTRNLADLVAIFKLPQGGETVVTPTRGKPNIRVTSRHLNG